MVIPMAISIYVPKVFTEINLFIFNTLCYINHLLFRCYLDEHYIIISDGYSGGWQSMFLGKKFTKNSIRTIKPGFVQWSGIMDLGIERLENWGVEN